MKLSLFLLISTAFASPARFVDENGNEIRPVVASTNDMLNLQYQPSSMPFDITKLAGFYDVLAQNVRF